MESLPSPRAPRLPRVATTSILACVLAVILVLTGCSGGNESESSDGATTSRTDSGTPRGPSDGGTVIGEDGAVIVGGDGAVTPPVDPDAPGLEGCSHWDSNAAYFAWLMDTRAGYDAHERYKGMPWRGAGHNDRTFPLRFTWSDALAAQAQAEAERVAGGGTLSGTMVMPPDPFTKTFWIDGINTADWRITAQEEPGDWEEDAFTGNRAAALNNQNGSARLGFFYHDFGGDGPVITQMGLAGVANADCTVTWVAQFAP